MNDYVIDKEIERIDLILSKKYLKDSTPIPAEKLRLASLWLESDISSILKTADDRDEIIKEIEELILQSYYAEEILKKVDFKRAYKEGEIRSDWKASLKSVKDGRELSSIVNYGFSKSDISDLAKIYLEKHKTINKKIEDLLEDCNFHYECGEFAAGNAKNFII